MHPLSQTDVTPQSEVIMRAMARSWVALANQMDRLGKHDPVNAAHLALARYPFQLSIAAGAA